MVSIRVQVNGIPALVRAFELWRELFPKAVAAGLYDEGQEWADEAVPLAPKRTGELRESAFVSKPEDDTKPVVEVGFGAEHAPHVHERKRTQSGIPEWLGETMRSRIPGYARRLLAETRRYAFSRRGVESVQTRWPDTPPPSSPSSRRGTSSQGGRGASPRGRR